MTRNRLLLVQTGTPPTAIRQAHGDLPRWFRTLLAPWQTQLTTVRVFEDEPLPTPDNQTLAVLTGSWAMVTDRLAWSERTADWIRQAVAIDMPLFGVCYGHQLMAHALGGEVAYHPGGRESGSQTITLSPWGVDDPLLSGLAGYIPRASEPFANRDSSAGRGHGAGRVLPRSPPDCALWAARGLYAISPGIYRADSPFADPPPGGGAAGGRY